MPCTERKNSNVEKIQLMEAINYLEKKIDRQNSEIKVLSEQLSKEIEIKEEILKLLS